MPQSSAITPAAMGSKHGNRWWILGVIVVAQLMLVLDNTVVNIALPMAQKDLGFTDSGRQWIITAYALAFGSLLLFGGRLSDILGRKRALIISIIGFASVSAIAGASVNYAMFVTARGVQGAFGALMAPTVLAVMTTSFQDPKDRAKAFGVFGAVSGTGGAIGLLVGGALTEYLDWRWSMYINVIIALIALFGTIAFIPGKNEERHHASLDLPGTLLITAGLFCLVYGFGNKATYAWGSPMVWAFVVASAALLALFVLVEIRTKHPLLPMHVVVDRTRGAAFIALLFSAAGMFVVFMFTTYYLQGVLAYSPVMTGVAFLPMIAGVVLSAQLSLNVITAKIGNRYTVPLGFLIAGLGMILFMRQNVGSSYVSGVLPGLVVTGLGLGIIFPACVNAATLGVFGEHAGVGSATVNASQQVGGSIGTAILNSLAITAVTAYSTSHFQGFFQDLAQKFHLTQADLPSVQTALKSLGSGNADALKGVKLPQESIPDIMNFAFKAQISGDNKAYLVTAIIFAVGAVFIGFVFRSHKAEQAIQADMTAKAEQMAQDSSAASTAPAAAAS